MYMNQEQQQHQTPRLAQLQQSFHWLIREASFQPVEVGLVGLVLYWCWLFLTSPRLFIDLPNYAVMAERAPQPVWAGIAGVIGLVYTVAVITRHSWPRYVGLLALIAWNFFTGLMFASAPIESYATGSSFICAGLAAWSLWRFAGRERDG